MQKLLVVCGPTATGKTKLGLELAKRFNGEIISADSRQVYKGMDIGTGKDIPVNSKYEYPAGDEIRNSKLGGVYKVNNIPIWGYDLVSPKDEFSVSQYLKFTDQVILNIQKRKKLPIVVGGTGLYIKGIVDGIPTVDVPKNENLRKNLENLTAEQLFENLSQMDSVRAASMNSSDNKNPRRLIRAIEIATWNLDNSQNHSSAIKRNGGYDTLFIGLNLPQKTLDEKINFRVEERIKNGFDNEVRRLVNTGVSWESQSMMSLGYRQWRDYIEGAVDIETATNEWKKEERKYSRRQIVWFKANDRINWFNAGDPEYQEKVANLVEKWENRA